MVTGGPDFVQQKGARRIDGVMKVVDEAAFFAAGGPDQGAELGFEQALLTLLGSQDNHQRYGFFGKLGGRASRSATSDPTCGRRLLSFCLRHGGGIVLQTGRKRRPAQSKTVALQSGGKPPHSTNKWCSATR